MTDKYRIDRRPQYLQLGHHREPGVAVLASDVWAYVDHHLAMSTVANRDKCRYFWKQSHHFAEGLGAQSYASAPLHLYYAMLNATKAMLLFRPLQPYLFKSHGISCTEPTAAGMIPPALHWNIRIGGPGVFKDLCQWMGDPVLASANQYELIDLLHEVVCCHRAYSIAFRQPEQFVPLKEQMVLFTDGAGQAGDFWFQAIIAEHQAQGPGVVVPAHLTRVGDTVQTPQRRLDPNAPDFGSELARYHRECRRGIAMIQGRDRTTHYFRLPGGTLPDWSQISLNFMIGLGLSSLARYHPEELDELYKTADGWIVKEYLRTALTQYVAFVAAEITGRVIQQPYAGG